MSTTTRRPSGTATRTASRSSGRGSGRAPQRGSKARGTSRSSTSSTRSPNRSRRAEVEVVQHGPSAETLLLASVAVLCLLGLVMVYSASTVASVSVGGASWRVVSKQVAFMAVGIGLAVVAARIPLSVWRDRLATPLILVAFGMQGLLAFAIFAQRLGLGDVPFAISVNGATRWLGVGDFRAQPSDLVKLALVVWLAKFLDARDRQIGTVELLKPVLIVTGSLAVLVMAGDDLGTTLLIGVIMLTMLFLAGTPTRQVMTIAAGGVSAALIALFTLEGFRLRRIAAFINPEAHRETEGYQLWQSQIGFASGGVWGNGPGNSRAKWGYLPQADTDFILAVIGEELGLIGSLVVLGAFAAFLLAGVRIALRSSTMFGRLVAFGITTWIVVQALINIGVAVGTLPTKGITLPFVSYGGSSLIMCLIGVGVMSSVARAR